MAVIIADGHVDCPSCLHHFEVKRKGGGGADRAKHWKALPSIHFNILQVFLSQEKLRGNALEKKQMRGWLKANGIQSTDDAINSYLSELYGCDIIQKIAPDVKSSPTHHTRAPKYKLNLSKAISVLNNGGLLK